MKKQYFVYVSPSSSSQERDYFRGYLFRNDDSFRAVLKPGNDYPMSSNPPLEMAQDSRATFVMERAK